MAKMYIGTSGWSYPPGKGHGKAFSIRGPKKQLEYYSCFFNTVEVNSSFYRPPNPVYVANWVKQTPPVFLFAVKLWQKVHFIPRCTVKPPARQRRFPTMMSMFPALSGAV